LKKFPLLELLSFKLNGSEVVSIVGEAVALVVVVFEVEVVVLFFWNFIPLACKFAVIFANSSLTCCWITIIFKNKKKKK